MSAVIGFVILAVVLVAVGMSFFVRRHGEPPKGSAPGPDWVRTDEMFRDPGSERMMRVWVDGTGNRHYVPEVP